MCKGAKIDPQLAKAQRIRHCGCIMFNTKCDEDRSRPIPGFLRGAGEKEHSSVSLSGADLSSFGLEMGQGPGRGSVLSSWGLAFAPEEFSIPRLLCFVF